MIGALMAELGPWNWMALGFLLLIGELVVPGVFLLWIGIAALITGAISLGLWSMDAWTWHWQVVVFLILSLVCAWAGKRLMRGHEDKTDEPLLNRRADQMIGRTATLHEPIVNGTGSIRLDDTVWRVTGPDLKKGDRVSVTGTSGMTLTVEPA